MHTRWSGMETVFQHCQWQAGGGKFSGINGIEL